MVTSYLQIARLKKWLDMATPDIDLRPPSITALQETQELTASTANVAYSKIAGSRHGEPCVGRDAVAFR